MYSKKRMSGSTVACSAQIAELRERLAAADAVVAGAGAGMSASAGLTYSGERFTAYFADFITRYHLTDMYSAGFYPFPTPEEYWAYWSRQSYWNRYDQPARQPYLDLLTLLRDKEHFVITTNVDHQFQLAGADRTRLFYMQGDYGLWQCAKPCHAKTYDNEATVRRMVAQQQNMRIPAELLPRCPVCGGPMTMNLRVDDTFVEDAGWHAAAARYAAFLRRTAAARVLYLELGVGGNTPGIIQYPFQRMTAANPGAFYVSINLCPSVCPPEVAGRSLCIPADIGEVLHQLRSR